MPRTHDQYIEPHRLSFRPIGSGGRSGQSSHFPRARSQDIFALFDREIGIVLYRIKQLCPCFTGRIDRHVACPHDALSTECVDCPSQERACRTVRIACRVKARGRVSPFERYVRPSCHSKNFSRKIPRAARRQASTNIACCRASLQLRNHRHHRHVGRHAAVIDDDFDARKFFEVAGQQLRMPQQR